MSDYVFLDEVVDTDAQTLAKFQDFLEGLKSATWKGTTTGSFTTTTTTTAAVSLTTDQLMELTQQVMDILEKVGWTQHSYVAQDGKVCLVGAARKAAVNLMETLSADSESVVMAWSIAVKAFLIENDSTASDPMSKAYLGPEGWNDRLGRTFEEVMTMLRDFMYHLKGL